MADTTTSIDQTLAQFSQYEFDNVCLAHLFVHRNYGNGVLGLGWVGDPSTLGNAGGICQKRVNTKEMGQVSRCCRRACAILLMGIHRCVAAEGLTGHDAIAKFCLCVVGNRSCFSKCASCTKLAGQYDGP